jgi:hypothetical protein
MQNANTQDEIISYQKLRTFIGWVPKLLNKYAGIFVSAGGDTIRLYVDSAGLQAKTLDNIYLLKQAGENVFFISEDILTDIKFIRNEKGIYDSFIAADSEIRKRKKNSNL